MNHSPYKQKMPHNTHYNNNIMCIHHQIIQLSNKPPVSSYIFQELPLSDQSFELGPIALPYVPTSQLQTTCEAHTFSKVRKISFQIILPQCLIQLKIANAFSIISCEDIIPIHADIRKMHDSYKHERSQIHDQPQHTSQLGYGRLFQPIQGLFRPAHPS